MEAASLNKAEYNKKTACPCAHMQHKHTADAGCENLANLAKCQTSGFEM